MSTGQTTHGLPFPNGDDPVNKGDDQIKALALKLDPMVGVDAAVANGFTAQTGWSVSAQSVQRFGPVVAGFVNVTRTGAALTVAANGDVTPNSICAKLDPVRFPLTMYGPVSTGASGRVVAASFNADGTLAIAAVAAPGVSIATNDVLSMVFLMLSVLP